MNIALYIPESERINNVKTSYSPPLGLLSIATYISQNNGDVNVDVFDGQIQDSEAILAILKNKEYQILGISTNVGCYKNALLFSQIVKRQCPNTIIVLGGPYVTILWKECLFNRDYVDYCIVGDGEYPFSELIKGTDIHSIPGLAYRTKLGNPVLNEPTYTDINSYPIINREYLDYSSYFNAYKNTYNINANMGTIYIRKGCDWRHSTGGCIFCGLNNPKTRTREPRIVWEEVEMLNNKYNASHFYDLSDTFCSDKKWIEEFVKLKPNDKNYSFRGYARASEIDGDIVILLKELGFVELFIGIESGDDDRLKSINKGSTTQDNCKAIRLLHDAGIGVMAGFVVGLPGESFDSLNKTEKFIDDHIFGFSTLSFNIFTPYPGSKVFHKAKSTDVYDWCKLSKEWIEANCFITYEDAIAFIEYLNKKYANRNILIENNHLYINRTDFFL